MMTLAELRQTYPLVARVVKGNAYAIPIGKEFLCARRKDGNGSPFPIEVFSYAGNYQVYQFTEDEVEVEPAAIPTERPCWRSPTNSRPAWNCSLRRCAPASRFGGRRRASTKSIRPGRADDGGRRWPHQPMGVRVWIIRRRIGTTCSHADRTLGAPANPLIRQARGGPGRPPMDLGLRSPPR